MAPIQQIKNFQPLLKQEQPFQPLLSSLEPSQSEASRQYDPLFNVAQNDAQAISLLKKQLQSQSVSLIEEFSLRCKSFLLQQEFKNLIEKYLLGLEKLVKLGNKHLGVVFQPDT